ncbi:hypothetical protein [Streptomyces sp. NPDC008122]|uniref:hypothetical protein n=1 Tax=Streptomyces sp. NPDC008122 TaxID=3364810 RepID=UPI0036E05B97
MTALADHGVTGKVVRLADHDVEPGVAVDMGDDEGRMLAHGLGAERLERRPEAPAWAG